MVTNSNDPVLTRRRKIARGVKLAKRIGYLALGIAVVTFFIGSVTSFPQGLVSISIGGLIVACLILPLPIVLGYGIKAAEREDRDNPPSH